MDATDTDRDQPDPLGHWALQELGDAWLALYRFAMQDGRPVLGEVHLVPRTSDRGNDLTGSWREFLAQTQFHTDLPGGGITARTIRKLRPFGALVDQLSDPRALIVLRHLAPHAGWRALADEIWRVTQERPEAEPEPRLHRLARVAEIYAAGAAEGRLTLNRDIANLMNRRSSQVRDDIYAARREGLLTVGGGHGRSVGRLTPKALDILVGPRQAEKGRET